MHPQAKRLVDSLDLKKHPLGGYYREHYRSEDIIPTTALPSRFSGKRAFSSALYFLLEGEEVTSFQRVNQDEVWHYYQGSSLELHVITKDGKYEKRLLGVNIEGGEEPLIVVRHGDWVAGRIKNDTAYTLAGRTTAPGFTDEDRERPGRDYLVNRYPQHKDIIAQFA